MHYEWGSLSLVFFFFMGASTQSSRFASEHGITPGLCAIFWSLLHQKPGFDQFSKKNYLLWALSWLKTNCREAGAQKTCGMEEKYFHQ